MSQPAIDPAKHYAKAEQMACSFARKLPRRIDVDGLKNAAREGLWEAAKKWLPTYNVPFEQFCPRYIKHRMVDWLREDQFFTYRKGRAIARPSIITYGAQEKGGTDTYEDGIARAESPEADPAETAMRGDVLDWAISVLPDKLAYVVTLRYRRNCSMAEIGDAMGVSESRASQTHKRAIDLLREKLERNEKFAALGLFSRQVEEETGDDPPPQEVMESLASQLAGLVVPEEESGSIPDVESSERSPAQLCEDKEFLKSCLEWVKRTLGQQAFSIMHGRYLLDQTFDQLGQRLGLSEARCCQIHMRAIGMVRDHFFGAKDGSTQRTRSPHPVHAFQRKAG